MQKEIMGAIKNALPGLKHSWKLFVVSRGLWTLAISISPDFKAGSLRQVNHQSS